MQYISALGCVLTLQYTSDQVLHVVEVVVIVFEVVVIVFEQTVTSLSTFFVGSIQDVVNQVPRRRCSLQVLVV